MQLVGSVTNISTVGPTI